jgi:hypothetical protein
MTGTAPGCGAAAMGELYPPHPNHSSESNNTGIIFMTFSKSVLSPEEFGTGQKSECQGSVIFL